MDSAELTKEAIRLSGGKTRLLGERIGYSPITIRRWRKGTLAPGPKALGLLRAVVSDRVEESVAQGGDRRTQAPARSGTASEGGVAVQDIDCNSESAPPDPPELVPVPPGSSVPGIGKTYAPASVPEAQAALLSPAPPPAPSRRQEVARGLEEIRARLAQAGRHPGWLRRASRRAKGLSSFCSLIGRSPGSQLSDPDLALERAQDALEDISQPVYLRRLWGHAVELLRKRGAQPAERHQSNPRRKRRGIKGARKVRAECKACGGSGKSSRGGPCHPCSRNGTGERMRDEPLVGVAAEALGAEKVDRRRN